MYTYDGVMFLGSSTEFHQLCGIPESTAYISLVGGVDDFGPNGVEELRFAKKQTGVSTILLYLEMIVIPCRNWKI